MKSTVRSLGAAALGLLTRERRLPSLGKVLAFLSIVGVVALVYLLGAAAMFFHLPSSAFLEKAFLGAHAWTREKTDQLQILPGAPAQSPTLIDKPDKTYDGFTLYTTNSGSWAALIDMKGNTVHRWHMPLCQAIPQTRSEVHPILEKQICWFGCHLFPNGDLLAVYHFDSQLLTGFGLVKLDKDSKLIWAYPKRVHHDLDVGDDGTIYVLTQEKTSKKPAGMDFLRAPFTADFLVLLSPDGKELESIPILEALRDSPYALTQQLLIAQDISPDPDYGHANSVMVMPKALAPRFPQFKEKQVLISLRNMNMLAVLDVPLRKAVWAAQGAWRGQHAAAFVDNGHVLLFDNAGGKEASRVLEFDPANLALAWSYTSEDSKPFLTLYRGATQRLPNGNTLIVDPAKCRIFEVSRAREVVWEAICLEFSGQFAVVGPYTASINVAQRYAAESLPFLEGIRPRIAAKEKSP